MTSKSRRGGTPTPSVTPNSFENIEALIDGIGNINIGRIGPIPCAAVAADEDQALAMLAARPGESLLELMARLDAAIGLAWEQDIYTDEINTPRSESRSR